MKRLLFFLCMIFYAGSVVFAQNDSLVLVSAKWECQNLTPEVIWKRFQFCKDELFNSNQNINIIELAPTLHTSKLAITYSDSLEKTSQIAMTRNAIAAINGSYFKMRGADPDHQQNTTIVPNLSPSKIGRNRSVVYLRVNDSLIAVNDGDKSQVRKRHQQGVIAINKNDLSILNAAGKDLDWEKTLIGRDIITSGPLLLISGNNVQIPDDSFCNDRHPRTAVGKLADGSLLLFIVDGRASAANGMTIKELQKTLRWLGCTDAINLDGGGSTTMYIKGQPADGVVNYPTDNKKFDHEGEREVANALLLLPE